MSSRSSDFYRDLPAYESFTGSFDDRHYTALPTDWRVLVARVPESIRAIEAGRYRDVNTVAVACIAAMRNAFPEVEFPFIFGGDGATFCIPEDGLQIARAVLLDCQRLARLEFDLDLRIGDVPVSLLRDLGTDVRIGKWQVNPRFAQAMLAGDGLATAEQLIRRSHQFLIHRSRSSLRANFEGFECRWNEVPSPSEENISLLVVALQTSELERRLTYAHVQHLIESIYGQADAHHPVHIDGLRLNLSPLAMRSESRVRNPGHNRIGKVMHLLGAWPRLAAARYLMAKGTRTGSTDWRGYRARLHDNTDFRKFDDMLRMVIAGTVEQRTRLGSRLGELAASGRIAFGMHASRAALITCVVGDYDHDHLHFLDGSDGGYALAAVQLKTQLKAFEAKTATVTASVGESLQDRLRDADGRGSIERPAGPDASAGSLSAPAETRPTTGPRQSAG